jgi:two-component system, LytTR family, response regulator
MAPALRFPSPCPSGKRERVATTPAATVRVVIVDDEPLARNNLAILLRRDSEIEIIAQCGSGTEAVAEIREHKPDLVFLDVQMPECDGFDVLELLGADAPPVIVFVTAYDEHALRAFEAGALDYLLKPFEDARFDRALKRAKERIAQGKSAPRRLERFAIKSTGQISFVKVAEIDWIEAADYYACLHVGTKNHLLRRSIADLEQDLDPQLFCRIHRSTIVNLDCIQGLKLNKEGEYDVLLKDGTRLRLSRGYRKALQERMEV